MDSRYKIWILRPASHLTSSLKLFCLKLSPVLVPGVARPQRFKFPCETAYHQVCQTASPQLLVKQQTNMDWPCKVHSTASELWNLLICAAWWILHHQWYWSLLFSLLQAVSGVLFSTLSHFLLGHQQNAMMLSAVPACQAQGWHSPYWVKFSIHLRKSKLCQGLAFVK